MLDIFPKDGPAYLLSSSLYYYLFLLVYVLVTFHYTVVYLKTDEPTFCQFSLKKHPRKIHLCFTDVCIFNRLNSDIFRSHRKHEKIILCYYTVSNCSQIFPHSLLLLMKYTWLMWVWVYVLYRYNILLSKRVRYLVSLTVLQSFVMTCNKICVRLHNIYSYMRYYSNVTKL